ncbi:MAG: hypothetical protein ACOYN0_00995 [Phycisphaerales bacterium]
MRGSHVLGAVLAAGVAFGAQGAVRFESSLSAQLWMDTRDSVTRGGHLEIQAVPTALASASIVEGAPGARGWVTISAPIARRTPDRSDANLFEFDLRAQGSAPTTTQWSVASGGITATQEVLFRDLRVAPLEDTVVRFELFTSWQTVSGSESGGDGESMSRAGWSAWQSDPAGPIGGFTNVERASPGYGVNGHAGVWWYAFSVTVPAGGSTTLEFAAFTDGFAHSVAVPSSGTAGLGFLALLVASSRRRV